MSTFEDIQQVGAEIEILDEGILTVMCVEDDRVWVTGDCYNGWFTREDFEEFQYIEPPENVIEFPT